MTMAVQVEQAMVAGKILLQSDLYGLVGELWHFSDSAQW